MYKSIIKLPVFILCVSVIGVLGVAIFLGVNGGTSMGTEQVSVGGNILTVRVADDQAEQIHGLSGFTPETLGADGMIFVFQNSQERIFWMSDMKFDLDILWVNDGKIVKIEQNVPAPRGDEDPVRMYSAPEVSNTVIELPAGGVEKWGISVGDTVHSAK